MTNEGAKFEILEPFCLLSFFFARACERIESSRVILVRAGKSTVCRRIRTSFSPEIVQSGAVKGLMEEGGWGGGLDGQ